MTSDGISTEDWDRVHELAIDVVNAADGEDDQPQRELLRYLARLTAKYGERPSILATEADFVDDPHESERLLLRAFDLALRIRDTHNVREISLSLASLYVDNLCDVGAASRWLEVAAAQIDPRNEDDRREFERIQSSVNEAKKNG